MTPVNLEGGIAPNYKDVGLLHKFVTERGKIIGRARTGITAKQQRIVTQSLKRARHLGLLPFIVRG